MNPVSLAFWLLTGCLLALAPKLLLGWPWWAALGAGILAAPPFLWLVAAALDRHESGAAAAPPLPSVPVLKIDPSPPCPRCGSEGSASVLYGLPAFSDELKQAIDEKRVVLAGCPVHAGAPQWICLQCGEKHGAAGLGPDSIGGAARRVPRSGRDVRPRTG